MKKIHYRFLAVAVLAIAFIAKLPALILLAAVSFGLSLESNKKAPATA